MIRRSLMLAAILPLAIGCVSQKKYDTLYDDYLSGQARIQELEEIAMDSGEDADRLRQERESLQGQNRSLQGELRNNSAEAARRIAELQSELTRLSQQSQTTGAIPGVQGIQEAGAFTYRVGGEFLFDPGKDEVKASGKKTLGEIADLLRQHDYKIEVAGHTDNDPVVATKDRYPLGNIELGMRRALSVFSALRDAGISENRMMTSSYGEHDPIGGDKNKNRRVEIRVLLSEPQAL